jgi:hypothetical protein
MQFYISSLPYFISLFVKRPQVHRKGKFSYYRLAGKEAFKTWQAIRDFAAVRVAEVQRLAEQYLHKSGELETINIAELRRRLATK